MTRKTKTKILLLFSLCIFSVFSVLLCFKYFNIEFLKHRDTQNTEKIQESGGEREESSVVTCFQHGKVLRNHQFIQEDLWVKNGKIVAPQAHATHSIDATGLWVVPGFIDLQLNGAFGVDFTGSPERLLEASKQLSKYGVTSFLPTVITSSEERYKQVLPVLQEFVGNTDGAEVLGLHLEGPFIHHEKKGCHNASSVPISEASFSNALKRYGALDGVRLVTLAPELAGASELIYRLNKQGIVVSAGHTTATSEQLQDAQSSGLKMVTHLFNAMPPLLHREPGMIGEVLSNQNLFYSIIVDGIHIHPQVVRLAWSLNPSKMILVTDAIAAMGCESGSYYFAGMEIEVNDDSARLAGTNTLAGSLLTMDAAIRNLQVFTGCSLVEAVEAATLKPAQLLGIAGRKGTLNIGADADITLLTPTCHVQSCYQGHRLWTPAKEQ